MGRDSAICKKIVEQIRTIFLNETLNIPPFIVHNVAKTFRESGGTWL